MRLIEIKSVAELTELMAKMGPWHAAIVVAQGAGFFVYYTPHTNHRLEDYGEVWDENGSFVS